MLVLCIENPLRFSSDRYTSKHVYSYNNQFYKHRVEFVKEDLITLAINAIVPLNIKYFIESL